MPLAQVTDILGQPTESSSVDVAVFSGTVSKWKAVDVTITVQFVNGKVVAKLASQKKKKIFFFFFFFFFFYKSKTLQG